MDVVTSPAKGKQLRPHADDDDDGDDDDENVQVISSGNKMTVKFKSDHSVTKKGFHATWRQVIIMIIMIMIVKIVIIIMI